MIYILVYSVISILGILFYLGLIEWDEFLNDNTLEDIALRMRKGKK